MVMFILKQKCEINKCTYWYFKQDSELLTNSELIADDFFFQ